MKIWLGTERMKDEVAIFIDRPALWCEICHCWHNSSLSSSRKEAEKEFRTLPVHGSQDLVEFNFVGNGRLGSANLLERGRRKERDVRELKSNKENLSRRRSL